MIGLVKEATVPGDFKEAMYVMLPGVAMRKLTDQRKTANG